MRCPRETQTCPGCGDRLIHQLNRGAHESSSAFGQYVHDNVDKGVYWADVDGVIYKVGTRILRVIEHKTRGGTLSKGQEAILPLLGMGIRSLAANELVHPQSGVFVVQSDPPFTSATARQHRHWHRYPDGPPVEMRGERWARFLAGEVDVAPPHDGIRAVS